MQPPCLEEHSRDGHRWRDRRVVWTWPGKVGAQSSLSQDNPGGQGDCAPLGRGSASEVSGYEQSVLSSKAGIPDGGFRNDPQQPRYSSLSTIFMPSSRSRRLLPGRTGLAPRVCRWSCPGYPVTLRCRHGCGPGSSGSHPAHPSFSHSVRLQGAGTGPAIQRPGPGPGGTSISGSPRPVRTWG